MELRHLRYFVMAAEEANISRAASRLNVSQPAVSRQIKDLEEELGVELFEREHKGLALTTAGDSALAHAREILRQAGVMMEAMAALARQSKAISIRVGFLPTALPGFLTEGMRRFNRENAGVCVQIFEMTPLEQEAALRNGEIDVALLGTPSSGVRREFDVAVVKKTDMAIAVPDDHRLAHRKSVELSELGGDVFLSLSDQHFPKRSELVADLFGRAGIDPVIAIHANGLSELLGLVGGGSGVALVPRDLEQLPHPGVAFLQMKKPKHTLQFSAAWRKEGDSQVLEQFVKELQLAHSED